MASLNNRIYVGSLDEPLFYFENDSVFQVPSMQSVALVGQELAIDSFAPIVADSYENVHNVEIFRAAGQEISTADSKIFALNIARTPIASKLIDIPYGTPVWYFNNDTLVGKFYIDHVTRKGANEYELDCVSAIGLLDRMYHAGGLYTSQTFGEVLSEILADANGFPVIDYDIDLDVSSINVSGWLPYDTKRNNLYQLIFANGVNIIKNPDGAPRFTFIHTAQEDSQEILSENIYFGGSVDYQSTYSKVEVKEHTYAFIPEDEPVSLYDNTGGDSVVNEQIWFSDAPVYVPSIQASEGLTLISATPNGARISGAGKLTGIPYVHAAKTVTMEAEQRSGDEKIVSVENCTMVNLLNSNNLALRLFNFYCSRPNGQIKIIKNSIIFNDERCGKPYRFRNPFGEEENAFLAEMDIQASTFNKADCVFYADYEPAGQMGLYHHCEILTGTGTWRVPEGVGQIYVVMIGGGQGGSSGFPGFNGQDARPETNASADRDLSKIWYGAEGGDGGQGGAGGRPGRVHRVTIAGADLATSYRYSCGAGGTGGAETGFIPDSVGELRTALENENPNIKYTDAQLEQMVSQQAALSGNWTSVEGALGTATSFGQYSTEDPGSYVPQSAGIYEPLSAQYFAQTGKRGVNGGKGGSRKVINKDGTSYWTTEGETVAFDGKAYSGGHKGTDRNNLPTLPEAKFVAYGGNGAGAAVGLSSTANSKMDGEPAPDARYLVKER